VENSIPKLVEVDGYYIDPDVVVSEWEGRPRCLPAALSYAEKGWHVFPAPRGEKKSHKSEKFSGRPWGMTRDPAEIKPDFARWPEANVAVVTGRESGAWVVETDTVEAHGVDGEAALRVLEEKNGALPDTLTGLSPSGSIHRYFKYPKDHEIRNSTSKIALGVDVRAEGGMVIAPPSVRGNGAYVWISNAPIADAPEWLVEAAIAASGGNGNGGERAPGEEPETYIELIAAAVAVIPNPNDLGREDWVRMGMAIFRATAGRGFAIFDAWSQKWHKYDAADTAKTWAGFFGSPPNRIGAGTIFHLANEASPYSRSSSPTSGSRSTRRARPNPSHRSPRAKRRRARTRRTVVVARKRTERSRAINPAISSSFA
jgi:hypothetical protein